jgi:hypothetical protein
MKKFIGLALALSLATVLGACATDGGPGDGTASPSPAESPAASPTTSP